MKKILYILLICISIIIIYIKTKDNKVYYLALGDEITIGVENNNFTDEIKKYLKSIDKFERINKEFIKNNYRTTDLNILINNNEKILYENKMISIKNAIIKADLITISIGMNDFINYVDNPKILYNNIINLKKDMRELLINIRNISKEKIYLIGIYNPYPNNKELDKVLKELNKHYKDIAKESDINYIDIYNKINNKLPNKYEYKYISDELIRNIKNDIMNTEV
ncbi:MAG TPA: SGNH/GDSL hydrolase family protein [Bacilli bacterium]|nr:SGNH/GDSL hydrolase family protein [Bacilli bacterium]